MSSPPTITASNGAPLSDNKNSMTAGPKGPILLQDFHLIDKLAHFDRERIPERVVHAKGAGAHGYFEVTHDVTKYCKADFLGAIGKRTPAFVRFSTVGGESGSADTARDPRGFAVKFYTQSGNLNIVGNNTPVFFVRDPMQFSDFIHTQKRCPARGIPDPNMFWDFLSLVPESNHQVSILFSDRGTPDGYRHMNGYGSHTFKLVNEQGEVFYCKFHFKTDQGIKNLSAEKAQEMAGKDPDYATRDLYDSIQGGKHPSWTLCLQVMPVAEASRCKVNVLDVTKVWSHKDYPLIPVGKLVLNRNPENYFQDVEQAAFAPSHLVPGIEPSEDKMLQARLFSYPDTHRHRLGVNYQQIPVNAAWNCPRNDYNARDGFMCVNGNKGSAPNYYPNSVNGTPVENKAYVESTTQLHGATGRHQQEHPNDDYEQAGKLFREVMNEQQRTNLINNLAGHLGNARRELQERQVKIFARCDKDYGRRLAQKLGLPSSILDQARM